MAVKLYPQVYTQFKGIREQNGLNSNGAISAIKAVNTEFFYSDIGSNTGIKSAKGNTVLYEIPDYSIIDVFSSTQDGVIYNFIYAENEEKGVLYYATNIYEPTLIIDDLPLTGEANGITMTSTAYDVFVFTNGQKQYSVCFAQDEQVKEIEAVDYLGREIHWLAMIEWNGFLVAASDYGVHASHQNDIYTWNDDPSDAADSWYIDFTKKVTAIAGFSSGMFIFTETDVSKLTGNPNETDTASLELVSMNGTLGYNSLAFHDTYLFFYDPKQKNIYYIQITDTGQTRPAGPIAKEVCSYFSSDIKKFRMYSCVYSGNNEIWCLVNDDILIYDYDIQEWVTRYEQDITTVCVSNNRLLTGTNDGKVLVEKINLDFDGKYYPCQYQTSYINAGSSSNIKKQKTPLLLSLNDNEINDFYIQLIINGKEKNPKRIVIDSGEGGVYGNDEKDIVQDKNQTYDTAVYAPESKFSRYMVEISTPQTWYTMSVNIYTSELGQGFCINSMELKNMKAKLKTKGR